MADNDQSIYNLRYNQVAQGLEGFGGGSPAWTSLKLVADGTPPGGPNGSIQYRNGAVFGGMAGLTTDGMFTLLPDLTNGLIISGISTNLLRLQNGVSDVYYFDTQTPMAFFRAVLDMGSNRIQAVADPSSPGDAATKNYVDTHSGGTPNVIQAVTTASTPIASSGFNDVTGLGVTITPSSNTAKIKLTATIILYNTGVNTNVYATLAKNGTNLGAANGFSSAYPGNGFAGGTFAVGQSFSYVDSPATTSAVGYTVQSRFDAGGSGSVGDTVTTMTLIAEEVH